MVALRPKLILGSWPIVERPISASEVGHRRWLPTLPWRPHLSSTTWKAAVICAASTGGAAWDHLDCHRGPFFVVFVAGISANSSAASVYSSETGAGIFAIDLKSGETKEAGKGTVYRTSVVPYTSFCTPGVYLNSGIEPLFAYLFSATSCREQPYLLLARTLPKQSRASPRSRLIPSKDEGEKGMRRDEPAGSAAVGHAEDGGSDTALSDLTEDLITEILLRITPEKLDNEHHKHVAGVCRSWRRILSDAGFRRRYVDLHRAAITARREAERARLVAERIRHCRDLLRTSYYS
ncbi:hypothetical protein HU200_027932 [Digitaria exilis]|uniref:F-box domain-containing protein n=1 Tax=Digitaria exilis TaxID=1010633 RepID=A0A835C0P9_9POAL|nr:hypothetical protein HU200_027932 [Digitaria exilis]